MEKFINLIKDNPTLYDYTHPDYTNKAVRSAIWRRICKECDFSNEKAAKVEWKRLRDTFRLSLNKPNGKKSGKLWRYHRQMNFLKPFMNHNRDKQQEEFQDVSIFEHMLAPNIDEQYLANENDDAMSPAEQTVNNYGIEDDRLSGPLEVVSSASSLDHFFLSMCETTKTLPTNLQTQVKRKIFQAVIEAEEAFDQAKCFGFTQVSECNSSSNCEDWPKLYVPMEETQSESKSKDD